MLQKKYQTQESKDEKLIQSYIDELRQQVYKTINSLDIPDEYNDAQIQARVDSLISEVAKKAEKQQLENEIANILNQIKNFVVPDVNPLINRLSELEKQLDAIEVPEIPDDLVNEDRLQERMRTLKSSLLADMKKRLAEIPSGFSVVAKRLEPLLQKGELDYIAFDTTPETVPTAEGSIYWDVDRNTLGIVLQNGIPLHIGQDMPLLFKNQSGSDIPIGTGVMFDGSLGASGRIKIKPMVADNTYPSTYFIGVAVEDIANGADGFVIMFGEVHGMDTSAWSEGDILYADPTTPGALTATEPNASNNHITVAVVVNSHAQNGTLFVRPTFQPKLESLQDVNGTPLTTNGQMVVWNNSNSYFDFTTNFLWDYVNKQHIIKYDASNYYTVSIGSTGVVTLDAIGSGASFAINKPINLTNDARIYKEIKVDPTRLATGNLGATLSNHGNYPAYEFGINDDMFYSFEIPYDYEDGTDLTVEIYWAINEAYATNNAEVQWAASWTNTAPDAVLTSGTTSGIIDFGDINIPATANTLEEAQGTISGTSIVFGNFIGVNISRVALDAGNNPIAEPYIIGIGIKYIANKLGESI